jgi:lactoylglutathione lyase
MSGEVLDSIILRSIGIGVSDIERSVDFYTRVCGMKEIETIKLEYMDQVIVGYASDSSVARGSRLLLMHWTDGSKPNYRDNPIKLVLSVSDTKEIAERIRAEGFSIVREPQISQATGNFVAYAKDPDGYVVELVQLK